MNPIVEQIVELGTYQLAEGPHWDHDTKSLYFVDIFGKSVHKYVPSTKEHTQLKFDKHPSLIIPVKGHSNRFIISLDQDIVLLVWDGVSSTPTKMTTICTFDRDFPDWDKNRINDGKADPLGNLWAGTLNASANHTTGLPTTGRLSTFSNKQLKVQETGICVANGLAWSRDLQKFYYIDTPLKRVDQYEFDAKTLSISNRRPLFTFEKHGIRGYPDGQTIDADGNLWVATFQGQRVLKIDTKKPETLLGFVELPDDQVTSVTVGGPNLDELYVTSANVLLPSTDKTKPIVGGIYKVTGLNLKGLPGDKMNPVVEQIVELGTYQIAEAPHWDHDTKSLYFVDIFGQSVHKYVPSTKQHTQLNFDKHPSIIIPVKGYSDRFIISLDLEIVLLTWDGVSSEPTNLETLVALDDGISEGTKNRINDGKADPFGNLWAGTMPVNADHSTGLPATGRLWSLTNKKLKLHEEGVCISNGLAWSQDLTTLYYIDTAVRRIDQFDFDSKTLTISNRRPLFTFEKHGIRGYPDGQTIDAEGNLWAATFQGQRVLKIDSKKPETLLGYVEFPDDQITSVTIGGSNLDELYVTSGNKILSSTDKTKPIVGGIYRVTGLNLKGLPGDKVQL